MDDQLTLFSPIIPYSEKDSCQIMALSVIFNKNYNTIREELGENFKDFDVIKSYLVKNGYHEVTIPIKFCEKRITIKKLTEISLGLELICFCGDHITAVKEDKYFDVADCGDMCVFSYFVKK